MLISKRATVLNLRSNMVRRNYTKDYSSYDDEKDTKKPAKNTKTAVDETAAAKLKRLLDSMKTEEPYRQISRATNVANMACPGSLIKKRREDFKKDESNKDVFTAVKRVASMFSGEKQKQTETELLAKLLAHTEHMEDKPTHKEEDGKKVRPEPYISLNELILGMKIERNPQCCTEATRGVYVRPTLVVARKQQQQRLATNRQQQQCKAVILTDNVNLFGAEPLGIFRAHNNLKESPDMLTTWAKLYQQNLQLQVIHQPCNYFEKIAIWTEQGKLWRFPIDNEQNWHAEETTVNFSEHIFLEQHLENWCPTKGPIRHFMELVCVGLSKNSYLTAREKKGHILWYRDYFKAKRELLHAARKA